MKIVDYRATFNLTDALLARGHSEEEFGKIFGGGNWLWVMDTVWGDPDAQLIDDDEDIPDAVPHVHKH